MNFEQLVTCFQNPPQSAILFSSSFCHSVPSVAFFFFCCYFVTSLNDLSPYFYVLLSLVDCEQFLFFSSDLVRGVNARACVERRSRETRVSRLQSRAWSFACLVRSARRTKKKERLLVVCQFGGSSHCLDFDKFRKGPAPIMNTFLYTTSIRLVELVAVRPPESDLLI